jgi:hypothetical protein
VNQGCRFFAQHHAGKFSDRNVRCGSIASQRVAAEFDKAPAGADTADASVVLQMVLMLENVERG